MASTTSLLVVLTPLVGCAVGPGPEDATAHLSRLIEASVAYYASDRADLAGQILPRQYPASTPLTPAHPACIGFVPVPHFATEDTWSHPTWRALGFAPSGPLYAQYQVISGGVGDASRLTVRVVRDPTCSGSPTVLEQATQPPPSMYGCQIGTTDELE